MLARYRLRQVVNVINLSTPLGLVVARLGSGQVAPWRDGILLASEVRLPVEVAPVFTLGNVVVARTDREQVMRLDALDANLMNHEAAHATQYAWCLGPVLIPLYLAASGWSWLRTGDWWSRNVFEQRAGLEAGGYRANPTRRLTLRSG